MNPAGFDGRGASANQIAHRLVAFLADPHRGELASAQEPGHGDSVTPIGLDPIAWLAGGSATATIMQG
jgi:hypothetical protein